MNQIKIEGIEDTETKVALVSNKIRYSFFKNKQDGNETKAYGQFKQFGFKSGDVVSAEVKETPGEYQGKKVTYRNIMFFETVNDTTPVVRNTPSSTPSGDVALAKQVSGLVSKINALENRIGELELKLAGNSIGAEALNF